MGMAQLRSGDWLGRDRVRMYRLLLAATNLAFLGWVVLTSRNGIDFAGQLLGTDFLSFWSASEVLHRGGSVYDAALHVAVQREYHVTPGSYAAFYYPPVFLLACWPLAWLGYFPALTGWLLVTGAAFLAALRLWLGRNDWLACAAFAPVVLTIAHGQTSFLLAALLGGGIALAAQGRKSAGGILLGLAIFKPQFGVLVPVVLLCAGEWRVIAAAATSAGAAALAATLAFGSGVWTDWWHAAGAAQQAMASGAISFAKMQSLFSAARLAGVAAGPASGLQLLLALGAALVLARLAWRRGLTPEVGAALLAGSLLTTPFVLDYDLLLLAFPLALLARSDPLPWERTIAAAAFVVPAVARTLALASGVVLAPFAVLALFAVLARRAAIGPQNAKGAAAAAPFGADGGRSKD